MANDRNMLGTVVIYVLFSFNLAAILKNYVSFSAHSSPMISHRPVGGAAKRLLHHCFFKFFMFAAPLQGTLADLPCGRPRFFIIIYAVQPISRRSAWFLANGKRSLHSPPPPHTKQLNRVNNASWPIIGAANMAAQALFEMLTLLSIWSMCFHH